MVKYSFEENIIQNAAATLAGIKAASLFNHNFASKEECYAELSYLNELLNSKGIYLELLKQENNFYLIYVYRRTALEKIFENKEISSFLYNYGYRDCLSVEGYINYLKLKLKCSRSFPHEIGIFLGYPLGDVEGFIDNHGKNCKYCGIWKVYSDEISSVAFFSKVKKCHLVYSQVFKAGRSIYDMTVRN